VIVFWSLMMCLSAWNFFSSFEDDKLFSGLCNLVAFSLFAFFVLQYLVGLAIINGY